MVRAKFVVIKTGKYGYSGTEVTLNAVGDSTIPEDARFHKYTPSGTLVLFIDNPPAEAFFELNKSYYLDFTPATVE